MFNEITNYVIAKYDSQVPRYTSYPTAPHFSSTVNGEVYLNWLQASSPKQALSLYIHIPFCEQLCWYCGCYTKATKRYAPIEDYVHILAREIKMVAALLRQKNQQVLHIHFGGGSPTILQPKDFNYLMQTIRSEFVELSDNAEIAIEVDPRNINEEKIAAYAAQKINRVSIGVQDFNCQVQEAINRQQSFELVYDCVRLFRKYGINNINLDLIYGLPKQTLEMIEKNINYAILLKPSRIALFSYAHVQWKKKHMRLIDENDLPDNLTKIAMYKTAAQQLKEEGYLPVGLDHFARTDDSMAKAFQNEKLKRNFQGYSTDKAENILGFGVSSISYLDAGYAQNTLDFEEYKKAVLSKKLPVVKGIKITEDDRMRKKIIDELMCYMEVDLKAICLEFNLAQNHFEKEFAALEQLKNDGLVRVKNNVIKINLAAPQIARVVSAIFDKFFQHEIQKYSKIA